MIHKIEMDWSLNIGNVISILVFLLAGIGAWYDVKSDVKLNHNEAQLKFMQIETFMNEQKSYNQYSERQRDVLLGEVKNAIRENSQDMKSELRDLRNEVMNRHVIPQEQKERQQLKK